ncbi:DUF7620 family protein [Nonomuraea sp. CA-218870]|uniref:DUF7620 family protein n=1 Tax=Nonomuraea sp. CA-218870 TaxID=3239998 RepID=UPI003D8F4521
MTDHDDERVPDIDEARQAADESRQRAEDDLRRAREQARHTLSVAARLRRLREANGFSELFDEAFGGRRG